METTSTTNGRVTSWNKGKLLGQKPPLELKEIWAIRIRLQLDHRTRELALFAGRGWRLDRVAPVVSREGKQGKTLNGVVVQQPEHGSWAAAAVTGVLSRLQWKYYKKYV